MREELVKLLIQETQSVRLLKTAVLLLTFLRHWMIFKVALSLAKLIDIVAGLVRTKTIGKGALLLLFTWVKWGQVLADLWPARLNVWLRQIVRLAKKAIETERAAGLSSSSSPILSFTQLHKYKHKGKNLFLRYDKIISEEEFCNRHRLCLWEVNHIIQILYGDAFEQFKNPSLLFASDLCLKRMFAAVYKHQMV